MFVTITSITTIMRARMLRAVSPLLIWFWSAFPWLFCNFVFKSSVAASWCVTRCMMNGYNVKAHGSVLMRVWVSPYALQVLNYDAHARSNCDAKMHAYHACNCVSLVTSYRIWIHMMLHCSWNAAHACEDMVAMSDMQIDVKHEKYLDAKMSWNFIHTVFRFMFCSCWPSPPSSSQALGTTPWEYGTWPRSSRSRSWKVTRTPWRQLRSTRAGSTWRQVRGEEHEQRRDMIARWTWWPSWQE